MFRLLERLYNTIAIPTATLAIILAHPSFGQSQAPVIGKDEPATSRQEIFRTRTSNVSDLPLTREQGTAILEELRRIEILLRSQNVVGGAPNAASSAPVRVRVKMQRAWNVTGSQNASVVMLEFTDLQCPVCQRFHNGAFSQLKADYIDTGKVQFVSRDLPLPMHRFARNAAEAARCAGVQGKFWEFRDAVLGGGVPPTPEELTSDATKLGIDLGDLDKCLKQGQFASQVKADEDEAIADGIDGTPAFIIGRPVNGWLEGTVLKGNRPYAVFQSAIEAELNSQLTPTGQVPGK